MRSLLACGVALVGLLGLELRASQTVMHHPAGLPAAMVMPGVDATTPTGTAASVDMILARPLFTLDRRPAAPIQAAALLPRLAGLVLAPSLHLALLQVSDDSDRRPLLVDQGSSISGWQVIRIDTAGVLLRHGGQSVALTLRQADARAVPPTPIDQIVLMPEKHINPQLAW